MRILIAEDERITRRTLQKMLEGWGHSVVATQDGAEAWERFEQQPFDIVVTDWDMPRMDGRELIRSIRGSEPTSYTYLIMLTGRSERADVVAGMEAGADDFLAKPVDSSELRVRLHAGERIIELERQLANRNRALSEANEQLKTTISELRETQAALVQSEKMASLGNLAAGVAHEINNPIGSINANSDVMIRAIGKLKESLEQAPADVKDNRQLRRSFDVLENIGKTNQTACDRVVRMVQSLSNFARLDEAERKRVDLRDGLESTLSLVHHKLANRIDVIRDYGDLPQIVCFPNQLNQVFMNMLLNAEEAIEDKGTITIRTRSGDNAVKVTIEDTGVGIRPEHLSKIFDPGFTRKGVGVGSGLGLAICYKIVTEHRGKIDVESELGSGSKFTITLPTDAS
jgi:signal transduction histidine kinase